MTVTTDEYFGGCPECGENDGYVNVGKVHVFVCHEHKTGWPIGMNLFSSCQDETEESQRRVEEMLKGYRSVEPVRIADPFYARHRAGERCFAGDSCVRALHISIA